METSDKNWLGSYELKLEVFTGYWQQQWDTKSEKLQILSSAVVTLKEGKHYILKFFNGAE